MCGSAQSKAIDPINHIEKEKYLELREEKEDPDPFKAARKEYGQKDHAYITTPGQNFDPVIKKMNNLNCFNRIKGGRIYEKKSIIFSQAIQELYCDIDVGTTENKGGKIQSKFIVFENYESLGEKSNKNTPNRKGANLTQKEILRQEIDTVHKIFDQVPIESPVPKRNPKFSFHKDKDFPPETSSIISTEYYSEDSRPLITSQMDQRLILALRYIDSFFWKSPLESDINFRIFDDKSLVNSIHQGLFLNDYFLAALGALACHDYRLAKKLVSAGGKENLEYVGFSFNHLGRWECVWVDSYLPFFKKEYRYHNKQQLVYTRTKFLGAQCKENELWVPLYEKAYAKLMGSYFNVAYGGIAGHVLTDLTGAPSLTKKLSEFKDNDEIWYELTRSYQLGYLICCDSGSSENAIKKYPKKYKQYSKKLENLGEFVNRRNFMKKGLGLVDQHTYSVMGLAVIHGDKLIKLRNVWGRTEWLGKWSDGSKEWLDENAEKVGHVKANDGIFYMPFEDFLNLFETVHFCYYEDEYVFSNIQMDVGRKGSVHCFDLEVNKKGLYFISLSQESHQKYNIEQTDHEVNYPPLTILITQDNGIFSKVVDGFKEAQRDVWIKADLSPGTYTVYVSDSTNLIFKDKSGIQ